MDPRAIVAAPLAPSGLLPRPPPRPTHSWADRAGTLARLLEEAEQGPGALWDGGLRGGEDVVRQALGYNMSDDPFFDANIRTREALQRLVARLGVVERKRKDLAVVLRWGQRLDGVVNDFLADYVPDQGKPLRWNSLDSACSAIVSRVVLLSDRWRRAGPRERAAEFGYAVQHVGGHLNLLCWRFEQLCHAQAFLVIMASGLRAARARHGALLQGFQEDASAALEEAARHCDCAAGRIGAVLETWAARIDRMELELLALQARQRPEAGAAR